MGDVTYHHILFPTFLFFTVLFGAFPLQIQVIVAALCRTSDDDDGDCDSSEISSQASMITVYSAIALYAPTILLTGTYGAVANRYGRKPVIFISMIGLVLNVASSLYIVVLKPTNILPCCVIGNLLYGLCGGYSTFIMAIFSYTSDATVHDPSSRKLSYPITEGCIFLPKLVAPIGAGLMAKYLGYSIPLLIAVILAAVAIVWVVFIPESLPLDAEVRSQPLNLNPMQTFQNIAFIFKHRTSAGASAMPYVAVAFCVYYIASIGSYTVIILYAKHRFNWGPDFIGYFDGAEGGLHAFSMLCLPVVVHYLTNRNFKLLSWIQIGYFFRALYWMALAVAPSSALFFGAVALEVPCGPIAPYTRTILSNSVGPSHQAQVFAAFSAIESIGTLIAPVYSLIYGFSVKEGAASLAFVVMSGSALVSAFITTYVRTNNRLRSTLPDQRSWSQSDASDYKKAGSDRFGAGSFLLDEDSNEEEEDALNYDQLRRLDYM